MNLQNQSNTVSIRHSSHRELTAEAIATALGGKRSGIGWSCCCPAHEDSSPSLSISEGRDGRPLFKCHTGCTQDQVIEALKAKGLWRNRSAAAARPLQTVEYLYQTPEGGPALKVVRTDFSDGKKTFRQKHIENGQYVFGGFNGELTPYLYDKWKSELNRWLILCEGEKVADVLVSNGFLATTTPGGAKNWKSDFAKYFAGRKVAILPDNDTPGLAYAANAYRDIKNTATEVKVIELSNLNEAEDAYDWFKRGNTADKLKKAIKETNSLSQRFLKILDSKPASTEVSLDEGDELIVDKKDWPAPLEAEAFHGVGGDLVNSLIPHCEADKAALLIQFLVGFGNMIGRQAFVRVGAAKHYCNLFTVLIGDSSVGRKGTAWEYISEILKRVDDIWWQDCRIFGLGSGEGLIAAVKDPDPVDPEELKKPRPSIAVPRDKRGFVTEGEFAATLNVFKREGSILSTVIRNSFDTGDLRSTVKRESMRATGAHISVVAHCTQMELKKLLSETDVFNGIGNRFMWVCSRRSKLLPFGGMPEDAILESLVTRIAAAALKAKSTGELTFSDEFKAAYEPLYCDLSQAKAGFMGVLTARAAPIILRLSAIYALLDELTVISASHLMAAVAVWQYAEASAKYIFGDSTGNHDADQILAALKECERGLTQTEIMVDVFNKNLSKTRVGAALSLLRASHLAHDVKETAVSGRPQIRWLLTRTKYELNEMNESRRGVNSLNSFNSYFVAIESKG